MAADAELYGDARDEQADNVVRLAEVVVGRLRKPEGSYFVL